MNYDNSNGMLWKYHIHDTGGLNKTNAYFICQ